ncbi:type II secretory pathway protein [Aliiglaciecola sp. 3_MG-2023]|uniref:pilus assembly PilX family protein n=1 Tax=Aliiglaciecola sp. 3_MG-2023 TaxID=3062644 RepID=UPI0026E3358D|nr:type II secretory pathway protein [Aliiglaciecola sp. 3_MG-2023]MDO6695536.1 type II secretory pathway protein [Aliiglaciecola sp. 3_MG-2023]
MSPKPFQKTLHQQSGSMLIIALFVIVIMTLLGLTMVKLLSSSSDSVIHEVYGARALHAAQSSMERNVKDAFPLTQDGSGSCDSLSTFSFASVPGLQNCLTVSSCTLTTGYEDETTQYYHFESTGICQSGRIVASRTVAVDAIVE